MTPRTQQIAVTVAVGAVCLTAGLLIHGGFSSKAPSDLSPPAQTVAPSRPNSTTVTAASLPETSVAPAWTRSASAASSDKSSSKDAVATPLGYDLEKIQRLKQAAEKLRTAGEAGKSPQDVLQAMQEFEAVNGSPRFGGMDLSVMRRNIELALQMRDRAAELDTLQRKLHQGDKSVNKDMLMAKLDDIRKLQSQLMSNGHGVTPGTITPPALTP